MNYENDMEKNQSRMLLDGGRVIACQGVIREVLDYRAVQVVRLENADGTPLVNNVMAVCVLDGSILWNIRNLLYKRLGDEKNEYYPEIRRTGEDILWVRSAGGLRCYIDLETLLVSADPRSDK